MVIIDTPDTTRVLIPSGVGWRRVMYSDRRLKLIEKNQEDTNTADIVRELNKTFQESHVGLALSIRAPLPCTDVVVFSKDRNVTQTEFKVAVPPSPPAAASTAPVASSIDTAHACIRRAQFGVSKITLVTCQHDHHHHASETTTARGGHYSPPPALTSRANAAGRSSNAASASSTAAAASKPAELLVPLRAVKAVIEFETRDGLDAFQCLAAAFPRRVHNDHLSLILQTVPVPQPKVRVGGGAGGVGTRTMNNSLCSQTSTSLGGVATAAASYSDSQQQQHLGSPGETSDAGAKNQRMSPPLSLTAWYNYGRGVLLLDAPSIRGNMDAIWRLNKDLLSALVAWHEAPCVDFDEVDDDDEDDEEDGPQTQHAGGEEGASSLPAGGQHDVDDADSPLVSSVSQQQSCRARQRRRPATRTAFHGNIHPKFIRVDPVLPTAASSLLAFVSPELIHRFDASNVPAAADATTAAAAAVLDASEGRMAKYRAANARINAYGRAVAMYPGIPTHDWRWLPPEAFAAQPPPPSQPASAAPPTTHEQQAGDIWQLGLLNLWICADDANWEPLRGATTVEDVAAYYASRFQGVRNETWPKRSSTTILQKGYCCGKAISRAGEGCCACAWKDTALVDVKMKSLPKWYTNLLNRCLTVDPLSREKASAILKALEAERFMMID